MKVKLSDLAKELKISVAAVSMALNNKKGVSDETRQRVMQLAHAKGYQIKSPHGAIDEEKQEKKYIKLLRMQKHGLIAIDTAFFGTVIEGIEEECKNQGYELLISYKSLQELNHWDIEEECGNNIQGLIIFATELDDSDMLAFRDIRKPIVILDSYFIGEHWDTVLMNNEGAAYQAVKYLAQCGHRKIGYLKSSTPIYNFRKRFIGYLDALQGEGLTFDSQLNFELEPTLVGAQRDMEILLQEKDIKELPTAFVADNDIIAVGAMNALQKNNIQIPEEISMIGIDDMPFCQAVRPELTTVKVYKKEIGKEAVNTLIRNIGTKRNIVQKREINTELIIRNSVKVLK